MGYVHFTEQLLVYITIDNHCLVEACTFIRMYISSNLLLNYVAVTKTTYNVIDSMSEEFEIVDKTRTGMGHSDTPRKILPLTWDRTWVIAVGIRQLTT